MAWLGLTPRVLTDDETHLVVEESHFGRASLGLCGLFLVCVVVAPAAQAGSTEMAVFSLALGLVVVGLPFLIAVALSRYRRLEVRRGVELMSVTVYRLRHPRSVRMGWDAVARVVCQRRRDSSTKPGRLVLTLHTAEGSERRLLAGWYSGELKEILRRHLADKFVAMETSAVLN